MFEDLVQHVNSQKTEANELRKQLNAASEAAMEANLAASSQLECALREEREQAAEDRRTLLQQITSLVMAQGETQEARVEAKICKVRESMKCSKDVFEASSSSYNQHMDLWNEKEQELVEKVHRSRESLKTKLKEDWAVSFAVEIEMNPANSKRLPTNTMLPFNQQRSLFMTRLFELWTSR